MTARMVILHWLAWIIAAAGLSYLVLLAILWTYQERIVFQPPSVVGTAKPSARRVEYHAADGTPLFAFLIGDCGAAARVIVAFHGNADLARWLVPWATRIVEKMGACVMLPEYRGYDGLRPLPDYRGVQLDARAAHDYAVRALGISRDRLRRLGRSPGGAGAGG